MGDSKWERCCIVTNLPTYIPLRGSAYQGQCESVRAKPFGRALDRVDFVGLFYREKTGGLSVRTLAGHGVTVLSLRESARRLWGHRAERTLRP